MIDDPDIQRTLEVLEGAQQAPRRPDLELFRMLASNAAVEEDELLAVLGRLVRDAG